jgi:Putative outer membrane beta-barrel porin, MtrB/PioB
VAVYLNEQYKQSQRATTSATVPPPAANTYSTAIKDSVNTFVGTINFAAIPDTLDLKLSYSVSFAKDSQPVYFDKGTTPAVANGGQYPDVKNTWQRLEAPAKYTFDKNAVRNAGIKGEMYAKLQYVWERNSSEVGDGPGKARSSSGRRIDIDPRQLRRDCIAYRWCACESVLIDGAIHS